MVIKLDDRQRDSVKAYLLERLVSGTYGFGEKVSAKVVSEETGASRFTVTAAFNELRRDSFLDIIPQVGCRVASPSLAEISDFFLMFGRIETVLAELAAERWVGHELTAIRRANERIEFLESNSESSAVDYRLYNLEFHQAVHQAAHSPRIAEEQRTRWVMADFLVTHSKGFAERVNESVKEHELVVDAIGARNPKKAGKAMAAHINQLGRDVVKGIGATRTPA
jgi:DNA-binding GntR family transcriptional regulator